MNYLLKCLFLSCLLISVVACTDGINETVISAYQLPVLPEPSYKLSVIVITPNLNFNYRLAIPLYIICHANSYTRVYRTDNLSYVILN